MSTNHYNEEILGKIIKSKTFTHKKLVVHIEITYL